MAQMSSDSSVVINSCHVVIMDVDVVKIGLNVVKIMIHVVIVKFWKFIIRLSCEIQQHCHDFHYPKVTDKAVG
ncbi:hypothetical protein [Paenisporosarcina sp. TG-14]|uniref:hypothetical protein n=1 Tax=Paenisporosarcina sp. TG-14 TaxID=1231057 RepID=UPI001ED988FF|nr:hypothetical protein [Paenisporosarcina sp. TG-14]